MQCVRRSVVRSPLRRNGFTVAELLIAVAIGVIVATAATIALVRQQQLVRSIGASLTARGGARDARNVADAVLRGFTPGDTFPMLSEIAVELRAPLGASTVCMGAAAGAVTLLMAPDSIADGVPLTAWMAPPEGGDEILARIGVPGSAQRWARMEVASLATGPPAACPAPFGTSAAAGARSYRLALTSPLADTVAPGAPIRLLRPTRLDLYRAGDGQWYLGYRRCPGGSCTGVQPVAGPLGGGVAPAAAFTAVDAAGVALTGADVTGVVRIDAVFGADGGGRRTQALMADSSLLSVAARAATGGVP